ncbi:MAG: hypothetical protein HUU32_10510 [Calditrichaceae bacterium]|nr:hypothetical protein [Calditrichia bacterium]NUQ41815.1 hypothetical protein [Calditrichaceae bacterium]
MPERPFSAPGRRSHPSKKERFSFSMRASDAIKKENILLPRIMGRGKSEFYRSGKRVQSREELAFTVFYLMMI